MSWIGKKGGGTVSETFQQIFNAPKNIWNLRKLRLKGIKHEVTKDHMVTMVFISNANFDEKTSYSVLLQNLKNLQSLDFDNKPPILIDHPTESGKKRLTISLVLLETGVDGRGSFSDIDAKMKQNIITACRVSGFDIDPSVSFKNTRTWR